MGAGLIQILANRGAENIFITFDAQVSLFKTVYLRHSNFSTETVALPLNNHGFGQTATCELPKFAGDLIKGMTLHMEFPSLMETQMRHLLANSACQHDALLCTGKNHKHCRCACSQCLTHKYAEEPVFGYCNALGHAVVENYTLYIGGKPIETQWGEWLEVWTELTQPLGQRQTYNEMIEKYEPATFSPDKLSDAVEVYVPLGLWFCKNIGLSLPMVSLYNHDVKLQVKFRDFDGCWVTNVANQRPREVDFHADLLVDYVYLDSDERLEFYERTHTYMVEVVQRHTMDFHYQDGILHVPLLNFKYCMKEIYWVIQRQDVTLPPDRLKEPISKEGYPYGNDHFNFSLESNRKKNYKYETFDKLTIACNGGYLFQPMKAKWFRTYHPYRHHKRGSHNFVYNYSWAEQPESHSPTGIFNFSMADHLRLIITLQNKHPPSQPLFTCRFTAYGLAYNVLCVENGMAAMVFH
jgi:hypothetical protein